MKTGGALRALCLAALLALGAPGTGHAAPTGQYVAYSADVDSACRVWAITETRTGLLGGPVAWVGVATLDYAVPVNQPGYLPTVRCDLVKDDVPLTVVNPITVIGAVAMANPFWSGQFEPWFTQDAVLCLGMSDDGGTTWNETDCRSITVVAVDDALDAPATVLDPVVCPITTSLAAEVNQLPPSVARIDPASGDVYVGGFRVYDCPPHGS